MASAYPTVANRVITKAGSSGVAVLGSGSATANSFGQLTWSTLYTPGADTVITGIAIDTTTSVTVTFANTATWSVTLSAGSATATIVGAIDFVYTGSLLARVCEGRDFPVGLRVPAGTALSASGSVSQPYSGLSVFLQVLGIPVANLE